MSRCRFRGAKSFGRNRDLSSREKHKSD
jgi:hypothetical protein